MRKEPRQYLAALVNAVGGYDAAAAVIGRDVSTINRRLNVRGSAAITEAFQLEDEAKQYLISRERIRDICRDARDRDVSPEIVERAAAAMRDLLDAMEAGSDE